MTANTEKAKRLLERADTVPAELGQVFALQAIGYLLMEIIKRMPQERKQQSIQLTGEGHG